MRDSRLFNPFFILSILNDRCTDVPRFCTGHFKTWLTHLYRNRGLPPLFKEMTVKEILNGTESETMIYYQRKSPRFGGDPTVRTSFNILPHDGRPKSQLTWDIFTGDINNDRARNILNYNQTEEFVTVNRPYYHVDRVSSRTGVQSHIFNPWNYKIFTSSATEGSQFVPDMNNNDDLVYYTDYFKTVIKVDFQSVIGIYGLKGFVFETPINMYERRENQVINGITLNGENPYHNYHFSDMFNTSSVFGVSYFVTEPMFSRLEGRADRFESTILNTQEVDITEETFWNDMII
mmetsp:Transcript_23872/g.21212  ORF Transcript_23872/g.21212 Transcript_23872/m.21212 type:complete len:291 (+) Transcript_23872:3-875(+)